MYTKGFLEDFHKEHSKHLQRQVFQKENIKDLLDDEFSKGTFYGIEFHKGQSLWRIENYMGKSKREDGE